MSSTKACNKQVTENDILTHPEVSTTAKQDGFAVCVKSKGPSFLA